MFEIILIAAFAGLLYAIYSVYVGDKTDISEDEVAAPEVKVTKTPKVMPAAEAAAAPKAAVIKKPTPQVAAPEPRAASAPEAPKNPVLVLNLRNPKTGEKAPFPNTYRFAKKWVKEIMVTEGLLDRVYTTSELENAKINQKVKEAIERLKTLEKYLA